MKSFTVLMNTKFVGKHSTIITARNIEEAERKARKLENQYNVVISVKQA